MSRVAEREHTPIASLKAAAAAAAANLMRIDQDGTDELKMTLTQLITLVTTTHFGGIAAAGSAMTFTATAGTDGVIGAVTSANGFGFGAKAELEFLIETVKANKAAIDVLRAL